MISKERLEENLILISNHLSSIQNQPEDDSLLFRFLELEKYYSDKIAILEHYKLLLNPDTIRFDWHNQ